MARLGGLGFGVGSGVGGVVQAHVEVAGRALCSVVDLEVLARHDAVEESRNALLDLPSEYLAVEGVGGRRFGGWNVYEDERVGVGHGCFLVETR